MKIFFAIAVLGTAAYISSSCSKTDNLPEIDNVPVTLLDVSTKSGSEGITTFNVNNIIPAMDTTNFLTADEIEFLYAMREDEKLNRDLYIAYAREYPEIYVFSNISVAESNHIAAIERVFRYYEIDYPEVGEQGVFADSVLQEKYNNLLKTDSAMVALKNLASLEEENIVAYKLVLETLENSNFHLLLENMIRASSNHLRAAVRVIVRMGGTYTPEFLDQESYDQIINNGFQFGEMYRKRSGKGRDNNGTNAQKRGEQQGRKGSVNRNGTCTESVNGDTPGTGMGQGKVGRGYRGGR